MPRQLHYIRPSLPSPILQALGRYVSVILRTIDLLCHMLTLYPYYEEVFDVYIKML
jgi:hypothetical protein